jgi:outer membrane protein assembly factor BamB
MNARRLLVFVTSLAVLAACDKDKDVDPPAELVDLKATLAVQEIWSVGMGGGGEKLRLALGLSGDSGTLYAASRDGEVRALDAANGRTRWEANLKVPLSAGPGAGPALVVVGTNQGEVIALESATGKVRWKAKVGGEVLAAPLVAEGLVVVRTVDARLRALAASDGKEQWVVDELVPRLSLRGTAPPVLSGEAVICGLTAAR